MWGIVFTDSIRVLDMAYFDCPVERIRLFGFTGCATWPRMAERRATPGDLGIFDAFPGRVVGLSSEAHGFVRSLHVPAPQPRSAGRPFVHVADPRGNVRCVICPLDQVLALLTFPAECSAAFMTDAVVAALRGRRSVAPRLPLRRMLERSLPPRFMAHFVKHVAGEFGFWASGASLHFVDGFCGIGGASIGAFLALGHRVRFYAMDASASVLVVYKQMLLAAGVLAENIVARRRVDMTCIGACDVEEMIARHPLDVVWLHVSPPCDKIARIQTQGGEDARRQRRREGMWTSHRAACLYTECVVSSTVHIATFENTCSLIPGRHTPMRTTVSP